MDAAPELAVELREGSADGPRVPAPGRGSSGSEGGASGDAEPGPPSPGGFIPAVKLQEGGSFQLHAWPAELGYTLDALPSEPAPAAPAWRRAGQWLSSSAAAAAAAAASLLPLGRRGRRDSKSLAHTLASRTGSIEVLSVGREQSAPYLPSKRRLGTVQQAQPRPAALRWRRAVQAVTDARELAACLDLLANRLAPADDRLHATVVLATRLQTYPRPERLAAALLARHGGGRLGCGEYVLQELFITGERLFGFFTPPPMGLHRPYFTATLVAVLVLLYFFMAGQYGQYEAVSSPAAVACLQAAQQNGTAPAWGPAAMVRWISPRAGPSWCFGEPGPGRFDARYLIDWGARWGPAMRSSPQRWLTSVLLHQSFVHMLTNCLMIAGFGWQLECKYGSWRIAALALLAALGGSFLSAATEAPCVAVVGASGIVFGLAGVTVADMVANFETLGRPLLRTCILLAFLIFFAVSVGSTASGTSHMSHVGGFAVGLCAALVLLPNRHRGRAEAGLTLLGGAAVVAAFVALPCVVFLRVLPGLAC